MNYLDDFLFTAMLRAECDKQIEIFLNTCKELGFPVAIEKTHSGSTILVFLGLLLDTVNQLVCIPQDKIEKALEMIELFLAKKKVTVLQCQHLCGSLNFLCRCILPGRAFLRRLYAMTNGIQKQHYHVRVSPENCMDLQIWKHFLHNPNAYYRHFITGIHDATAIDMYSDASRNFSLGFGAYCGTEWTFGQWDDFCRRVKPSIEYLELFGVTVAVKNWLRFFRNSKIILFCDNEAVVSMINHSTSKCPNCTVLIWIIVFEGLLQNSRVYARYVSSKDNGKADALSRFQWKCFEVLAKHDKMNERPIPIPQDIWPIEKIWLRQ